MTAANPVIRIGRPSGRPPPPRRRRAHRRTSPRLGLRPRDSGDRARGPVNHVPRVQGPPRPARRPQTQVARAANAGGSRMKIQTGMRVACQTAALATPDRHSSPQRVLPSPGLTLVQPLDGEQPEHRSRDLTGRVLTILGIDPDTTYQAQLAVQELATNARRHAPPPHELHITICTSEVKIAITDAGPHHEAFAQLLAAAPNNQSAQDPILLSQSARVLR